MLVFHRDGECAARSNGDWLLQFPFEDTLPDTLELRREILTGSQVVGDGSDPAKWRIGDSNLRRLPAGIRMFQGRAVRNPVQLMAKIVQSIPIFPV